MGLAICSDKATHPMPPNDHEVVEEEKESEANCSTYSLSKAKTTDDPHEKYLADMLERRCGSSTGPAFTSSLTEEMLAKRGKQVTKINRKSEAVSKDACTLQNLAHEMR